MIQHYVDDSSKKIYDVTHPLVKRTCCIQLRVFCILERLL
jgi:hypothetical protein